VFFKAVQKQHLHEQSYHVVAVEGLHPDEFFKLEATLHQQLPEIESFILKVLIICAGEILVKFLCQGGKV
jgi:hypothetical protein